MIHGPDVAAGLDVNGVSWLDLDSRDVVVSRTDFIGVDGAHRVDCPGILGKFKDFLSCLCDLESTVILDGF